MRSLILVAVILQLTVIIIECHNYKFGDMIAFPRRCGCIKKPVYKHFAIYVGDKPFPGKQPGQDIFHHTLISFNPIKTGCVFGEMEATGNGQLDNYLDDKKLGDHTFTKLSDNDIKTRIMTLMTMEGCGGYNPLTNNCEHLATYVRYGEKITKQEGTAVCIFCCFSTPDKCPDLDKIVNEIEENARREAECWSSSCADLAG